MTVPEAVRGVEFEASLNRKSLPFSKHTRNKWPNFIYQGSPKAPPGPQMTKSYDLNRKEVKFEVGNLVMRHLPLAILSNRYHHWETGTKVGINMVEVKGPHGFNLYMSDIKPYHPRAGSGETT